MTKAQRHKGKIRANTFFRFFLTLCLLAPKGIMTRLLRQGEILFDNFPLSCGVNSSAYTDELRR